VNSFSLTSFSNINYSLLFNFQSSSIISTSFNDNLKTHMYMLLSLWIMSSNLLRRKYAHLNIITCEMWWLIHRISMFYRVSEYTRLNTVLTVRLPTIRLAELLRNMSSSLMLITIRHLSQWLNLRCIKLYLF